MNENDETPITSISQARTLEEIAEYWDTHSLAEYWDQTQEVEFDIRVKPRHRVTLAPELFEKIESQARIRGINPETLINLWLAERLRDVV